MNINIWRFNLKKIVEAHFLPRAVKTWPFGVLGEVGHKAFDLFLS